MRQAARRLRSERPPHWARPLESTCRLPAPASAPRTPARRPPGAQGRRARTLRGGCSRRGARVLPRPLTQRFPGLKRFSCHLRASSFGPGWTECHMPRPPVPGPSYTIRSIPHCPLCCRAPWAPSVPWASRRRLFAALKSFVHAIWWPRACCSRPRPIAFLSNLGDPARTYPRGRIDTCTCTCTSRRIPS